MKQNSEACFLLQRPEVVLTLADETVELLYDVLAKGTAPEPLGRLVGWEVVRTCAREVSDQHGYGKCFAATAPTGVSDEPGVGFYEIGQFKYYSLAS